METIIKSFKVKLHPTKEQEQKMWQSAGTARWAYNWTLGKQQENYKNGGEFLQDKELRKELTQLKKTDEYNWLTNVSAQIPKQAIKDACEAYKRFFKGYSSFPKFKSKKKSKPKFYQREDKLKIKDKRINLEKIGWVKLAEPDRIPEGKYYNPRVVFDGLNWYITVGVEIENPELNKKQTDPIGVDVGVKELSVLSTGEKIKNINKSKEVRRLNKKLKRLQRRASRHYEKLKNKGGENRYRKSKNLIKLEKEILKIHKRLNNIRDNHIHQLTTGLVKTKPEFIVIEDLNIKGMLKNKHLSDAVRNQKLHKFKRQLEYKCDWYGVKLIIADRTFPSSKTCSKCGEINQNLKLSDRVFECSCGLRIDRDLNASLNLKQYGYSQLAS